MAKNNRIMGDDIARMPPHIQASIAAQLASQGSALPPARKAVRVPKGEVHKVELSRSTYIAFGSITAGLWILAGIMWMMYPY
jgi:hypothetical protein